MKRSPHPTPVQGLLCVFCFKKATRQPAITVPVPGSYPTPAGRPCHPAAATGTETSHQARPAPWHRGAVQQLGLQGPPSPAAAGPLNQVLTPSAGPLLSPRTRCSSALRQPHKRPHVQCKLAVGFPAPRPPSWADQAQWPLPLPWGTDHVPRRAPGPSTPLSPRRDARVAGGTSRSGRLTSLGPQPGSYRPLPISALRDLHPVHSCASDPGAGRPPSPMVFILWKTQSCPMLGHCHLPE